MRLASLLPAVLLSLRAALLAASSRTFRSTDPITGRPVECDSCAPGTYLRSRCTSAQKSDCAPCPPGSFTELWNYIGKCLRCGVCGQNQVVKTPCSADTDCQCECRPGYFFKESYDMCVQHRVCPAGQGVLSTGTADEDVVCHTCPNGTFSDSVSAHQNCTKHKSCRAAGLQLLLRGSAWHNNLCTNCEELKSKDGADYLKEILPAFFVHQKLSMKRLRQIVNKLPSEDGKTQGRSSRLDLSDLHEAINTWMVSATAKQIRQLPQLLRKTGASSASERLLNKLQRIDSSLTQLCVVDAAFISE
ncbi:tumor necrosis factor receptor superfamily member 6B [Pempheris klunzingeri]|uniref:tumor necrosis factor receptor superfamily member 6B n=1 Tax=Pempheris klunzingeri TaxID=3127111 RepID=UPI0039811CC8